MQSVTSRMRLVGLYWDKSIWWHHCYSLYIQVCLQESFLLLAWYAQTQPEGSLVNQKWGLLYCLKSAMCAEIVATIEPRGRQHSFTYVVGNASSIAWMVARSKSVRTAVGLISNPCSYPTCSSRQHAIREINLPSICEWMDCEYRIW